MQTPPPPDGRDPDGVAPDNKDWTWVLDRPCPECGFDASEHPRDGIAAELRAQGATWRRLLSRPEAAVRRRPAPGVWSILEYGCHVRDVLRLFLERLDLMLAEDAPTYPNWDQDATAIADRYAEQDPAKVAYDLAVAAGRLADRFDQVRGDTWNRIGHRSDGATFTVESFARYLLHDPVHHVWDVERWDDAE